MPHSQRYFPPELPQAVGLDDISIRRELLGLLAEQECPTGPKEDSKVTELLLKSTAELITPAACEQNVHNEYHQ